MARVLITGASGVVGSKLAARLEAGHEVVALSRGPADAGTWIRGDFASAEDLRALDGHRFDVAVHLGAVLYGCSEEEALAVNFLGTRTLVTHLADRGCRRFVVASSIAATGCMAESFVPRRLPIPDDHPCDAVDPYGLSKALMEELCLYLCRSRPELEIDLLRIGGVVEDETDADAFTLDGRRIGWESHPFLVGGGLVALPDVTEVFARAVERPLGPGARRVNVVGETASTPIPSLPALEQVLARRGAARDLGFYTGEGRERASFYSTERLVDAFGLRPATGLPAMVK